MIRNGFTSNWFHVGSDNTEFDNCITAEFKIRASRKRKLITRPTFPLSSWGFLDALSLPPFDFFFVRFWEKFIEPSFFTAPTVIFPSINHR